MYLILKDIADTLNFKFNTFRLPGEAQKIDRMMESFAQRYCSLNPNIFTNPDTCYVLSFAVIMLNTWVITEFQIHSKTLFISVFVNDEKI